MSIGDTMQEARSFRGVTQEQLAFTFNISRALVSHVEKGRRKLPEDIAPKTIQTLDCGFHAMEVADELTGGAFIGKLNGDIDLHRSSVKAKAMEELEEAMQQLKRVCLVSLPEKADHEKKEEIKHMLNECIDVIVCLSHFVAVLCREYGFSWVRIWKDHRAKLRDRNYIK